MNQLGSVQSKDKWTLLEIKNFQSNNLMIKKFGIIKGKDFSNSRYEYTHVLNGNIEVILS